MKKFAYEYIKNTQSKIIISIALSLFFLSFFDSCARFSIREINFYDEKTALENQILGTYKEIEADPWLTTSIRISTSQASEGRYNNDTIESPAFDAFRTRLFIEDSIDDYRQRGIIGEGINGLLKVVSMPELSAEEKNEVLNLLDIENNARNTIATVITRVNKNISSVTEEEVQKLLHSLFCQEAPLGTPIETEPEKWQKKNKNVFLFD